MAWSSERVAAKVEEERMMLDAELGVTVTIPKNPIGYISSPIVGNREIGKEGIDQNRSTI